MEHGAPEALAGDEFMHHVTTLAGVDEHLYIIHVCMYACMNVCVCMCVCVCMYVYTHTHEECVYVCAHTYTHHAP